MRGNTIYDNREALFRPYLKQQMKLQGITYDCLGEFCGVTKTAARLAANGSGRIKLSFFLLALECINKTPDSFFRYCRSKEEAGL